jgi:prolipoprotein diacylglyceryltransferase
MDPLAVLRLAVLVAAAAAMLAGVLVMVGLLVPRNFPEQYRVVIGLVVFLYGLHRFVVTYFRQPRRGQ